MIIKLSGEIVTFYKYKRKFLQTFSFARKYSIEKQTLKILFFGTDNFSLPSIKILHNARLTKTKVSLVSVVTSFKSPANCVRCFAEENSISLHKWPVSEETCRQYDLGVVVSFGHMIPENIIKAFSLGMINVHASMLPRWRGAAPIIYSIMKGDTKTGVSVMKIEPNKFDVGSIYSQKEIEIGPHVLMPELHKLLAEQGADLLNAVLQNYPESFKNPKEQNDSAATYAPKIVPRVAEVNWSSMTSSDVYNLYRALYGYKNVCTTFQGFNVKLMELREGPQLQNDQGCAGSVQHIRGSKCLRIRCKDGTSVDVLKVRVEGKRAMSALEFRNGFLKKCENVPQIFI